MMSFTITEEDVTSNSNSVATNNVAERNNFFIPFVIIMHIEIRQHKVTLLFHFVSDILVSTQHVKFNSPTEPITIFTEEYLNSCIKNLLDKIDRLKVDFHDLEYSLSGSKEASTSDLCRKRLTKIIVLIEKVTSLKVNLSPLSDTSCSVTMLASKVSLSIHHVYYPS